MSTPITEITDLQHQIPTLEQIAEFKQKQRRAILVKHYFPDSPTHPYQMKIVDNK